MSMVFLSEALLHLMAGERIRNTDDPTKTYSGFSSDGGFVLHVDDTEYDRIYGVPVVSIDPLEFLKQQGALALISAQWEIV